MFDPCRYWRRLLSRRTDGTLSARQRRRLERHLGRCADCRAVQEADDALRAFGIDAGYAHMDVTTARGFDDGIVSALGRMPAEASPAAWLHDGSRLLRAHWNALPFGFLKQVVGGAFIAAYMTVLCLLPALRPTTPATARPNPVQATRAEPPVPMESLLSSPSPRAALLWGTAPTTPAKPIPASDHADAPTPAARQPEKDGALLRKFILG